MVLLGVYGPFLGVFLAFSGANCCYVPGSYVIFMAIFVNLLLFNELAPEILPIDRKRTDPKVGLRYSFCYRYQPDLRILTRSTCSPPPRDITCRRRVYHSVPHPKLDSTNDWGKLAGRVFYPGIFRVPARQTPR